MALNAKQKLFIQAYLVCKNGAQAAREAGYAESGAKVEASRLLTNPNVAAAIRMGLAKQEQDLQKKAEILGVTKERMIQELSHTAFSNMGQFAQINESGSVVFTPTKTLGSKARAIKKMSESITKEGGSTSLELHSKDRAQELLCKLMGWTKEELNLNMPMGGVQVILTMPSNGSEAPKKDKK